MKSRLLTAFFASCLGAVGTVAGEAGKAGEVGQVGEVLPLPVAGGLDLHHINTGQGNAAFFVFPDGTTMVFDCGDGRAIQRPPNFKAPSRPDESRSPGEWVTRYLRKFHPQGDEGSLDYLVVSHFHSDHMGGVPDLLAAVKVGTLIDRSWPDYEGPVPFRGALADSYIGSIRAQIADHGAGAERIRPGASDQIVLRRDPARYASFEVRNLAANTEVWTGNGEETRRRTPEGEVPGENACSIALRIRYGDFDYFTGGDLPGVPGGERPRMPLIAARRPPPEWADLESPLAWVTGPVDVLVLNHHGGQDTTNAFFLSVLQPRVAIAQVWDSIQVTAEVLKRLRSEQIYPGPRDLFTTNGMWEGKREHMDAFYGEEVAVRHAEDLQSIAADHGHVVVRVDPGGASYHVYTLEDSAESFRIRSVHGPYSSR